MVRHFWLFALLACAGCGGMSDILTSRSPLFGSERDELVGSFRSTDYAVGQHYATRRELMARRLPGGGWSSQYYLTGNDSAERVVPEKSLFNWSDPEQATIVAGTHLKITQIQPPDKSAGQSAPLIFGEVLDGPLKGKRVFLSSISCERRFVDPEFLVPTETSALAAVSAPRKSATDRK
ncbi:MAG TPA: hypothetical protein VFE24_15715 [Pirellulales bacterium]|jgi:hypothetical protein|nr:hypothetical protein [Pirellulales bacterium]